MFGFLKNTFKKKPSVETQSSESKSSSNGGGGGGDNGNDPGKERIRSRVLQNVKITQRDKREKLLNSKRDMTSSSSNNELATTDSQVNSTYLVHSNQSSSETTTKMTAACAGKINKVESNRRKLLEEWRKKKKEEQSRAPPVTKPVFKVHHVDNKFLSKTSTASASSSQLPSSSSFNFHMKMDTSSMTKSKSQSSSNVSTTTSGHHVPGHVVAAKPVTRSHSKLETTKPPPPTTRVTNPRVPMRSASSLTEAKRPPPMTHASREARTTEAKKTATSHQQGIRKPPSNQVSKTALTAPPQPVHNSTLHDQLDDISNKIDSAVVISPKSAPPQPPPPPEIKVTSPVRELEPVKIATPPPAISAPVIDSAYFESIELDKRDVAYYKSLLDFKTQLLNSFCEEWEKICGEAPDDVQGDVRSACGLAKLLIDERFNQFADLIRQCENSQVEKSENAPSLLVKCTDLQGYWDMVEYQVQDVSFRFDYLQKLRENSYVKTAELTDYFEKKMNANKPKELELNRKPNESKPRPGRNYLKKQKAVVEDNSKAVNQDSVAPPPPPKPAKSVKSRFAEFRAAKLQQQSSSESNDVPVEIILPSMPKTPANEQVLVDLGNSESKTGSKSGRRSRKSNVAIEPKKYNLRSRPSDLINFDSPSRQSLLPNNLPRKSIMPTNLLPATMEEESNMTIRQDAFSSPCVNHENNRNKDREDKENNVEDFFGEEDNFGRPNLDVINMKLRASIAPAAMSQNAIFTPQRRVSVMRESLEPDRIINLSRSPLLKLALISSHSKRLSTSRPVDLTPL